MNRNLISVVVSTLMLCGSVSAQSNKNKELTRQLEVYREYEPVVSVATKIDVKPNLVDTVKLRPEFNYNIALDRVYNRDRFSIKPIGVADVNVVSHRQVAQRLDVVAGLGFPIQSLADVNYALVNSPKTQVNMSLTHRGQWCKIENDANVKAPADQTQNQLSLFANRTWKTGGMMGELYGLFDKYTRYGYYNEGEPMPDTFDTSKSALAQRFSGVGMKFAVSNVSGAFGVNFLFDAATVADKFDGGRTDLDAELGLGYMFKNSHSIDVKLGAQLAKGKDVNKTDISVVSVAPVYTMKIGKTTLGLGFQISASSSADESKTLFFPKFTYESQLANGLNIYAMIDGQAYIDNYMANPYLVSDAVAPLSKRYGLQAGLSGSSKIIRYTFGVGYDMMKDYVAYINLFNNKSYYNTFGYLVDDVDVIKGFVNLDLRFSDQMSLQSDLLFRSTNSSDYAKALYLPNFEAAIALKYSSQKFQARLKCKFVGEQYFCEETVYREDEIICGIFKVDGYVDLGFECNYKLSDRMSVGLDAGNITNSDIYKFNHYKSIGTNLMAKVNLKF